MVIPMSGIRVGTGTKVVEPRGCFIADQRTRQGMSIQAGEPDTPEYELACAGIVDGCMKRDAGYVPGVIQVRDPELAALIRPRLAPHGIRVDVVESLEAVDELVEAFKQDMMPPPAPGWLDAPGMTVERLSAYAQAAAMMFKAAPWQYLANEDLIQIESPAAPNEALRFASVMGAAGEVFGIAFFPSRQSFGHVLQRNDPENAMAEKGGTALIFNDAEHLPPGDTELWLAEQLPLADDHAYPLLLRYPPSKGFERLDGPAVTFVEGLCRALAQTTEAQIDTGRWEQAVETCDGPATYHLSIPSLLEAMRGEKPKRIWECPIGALWTRTCWRLSYSWPSASPNPSTK